MKARPILMSGPMVRALLDGRKTQTRRVVKPQPHPISTNYGDVEESDRYPGEFFQWKNGDPLSSFTCPYGRPGDLLWVRESLRLFNTVHTDTGEHGLAAYWAAGGGDGQTFVWNGKSDTTGIPSIHMPRWASRLTLELTELRVERLQDISRDDAVAEGLSFVGDGAARFGIPGIADSWSGDPRQSYQALWKSINGPESWDANSWVWVLSFRVHRENVDEVLKALVA